MHITSDNPPGFRPTAPARYAEVLLPLPIEGTFTYSVPEEEMPALQRGCRVLVQFGRKKYYTGIVVDIHGRAPKGYDVKPLIAQLDAEPVVRPLQLKFWDWVAGYYLCTPGEVMKAALPTGLKIESETFIALNPDFRRDEAELSETESIILIALEEKKKMRVQDVEKATGIDRIGKALDRLMDIGAVEVSELAMEHYRPRTENIVELCAERDDHDRLHSFFEFTGRSARQERLLLAYIEMSGWMRQGGELKEVPKKTLVEASGATPGIFKALVDKGIFRVVKKSVNRFNVPPASTRRPAALSAAQATALSEIEASLRMRDVCLLHGITGSGKTEIYTHLIAKAMQSGKQVLYLVPEISLTTQLTDRLRKVFGTDLLVYHSKFSDNERVDVWRRLLENRRPMLVLGVRSSVFLPLYNLGLVIIDEEHEASFKQYDPAPRYNARDAAIMLGVKHGAKILLGSATPSVETYYKAVNGKYGLVELKERYEGATLPDVEIVDMRRQRKEKLARGIISKPLHDATLAALDDGRQAIMFQNRRGFAPVVVCRECGWTPKCLNCDVSPVYHKHIGQLRCHYCGHAFPLPNVCPACGMNALEIFGYGTERIAEEMHEVFGGYRVARMDLDTTRNKEAFQEIIDEFARKETDILVGTQMVSKGLDFERVSVVGVLNADTLLNFPDFRSGERAFNMLEQVAGRAGRRAEKGRVIIQTTSPANPVLAFVKAHDYAAYYAAEIADRQRFRYPPFTRIVNIYLKHRDAATVDSLAVSYSNALRRVFGSRVLGPEKPYVSRVSTFYLQSIMLKIESEASMAKVKDLLRRIYVEMAADSRMKQAVVYYDVDPV